ncbi:hypothetical protein B0H21DRAFT_712161 [Amylocystis lapponica]|nr:hypothetical protein B0H21DRAFT_712161 [Amylocystis lapponica]
MPMPFSKEAKHGEQIRKHQREKIPCGCTKCNGKLQPRYTVRLHQNAPRRAPSDVTGGSVKLVDSSIFKKIAKKLRLSPKPSASSSTSLPVPPQTIDSPGAAASAVGLISPAPARASESRPPSKDRRVSSPIADVFADLALDVQPASSPFSVPDPYEHVAPQDFVNSEAPSLAGGAHEDNWPTPDTTPFGSPAPSHRSLSYEEPLEAPNNLPPLNEDLFEGPYNPPPFDMDIPSREESPVPPGPEHHSNEVPAPQPPFPEPDDNGDAEAAPAEIPIERPPASHEIIADSSDVWFWRILMLLCSWLHLQYHVPHRACALILQVMRFIFIAIGMLTRDSDAPITLLTSLNRLQLRDNFDIKAMCVSCHRLYDGDSEANSKCSVCNIPLFKSNSESANAAQAEPDPNQPELSEEPIKQPPRRTNTKTPVPQLQTPYSLLSTQLPEYIVRLEKSLDSWRDREPTPDAELRSIQDGHLWKTLPGPDGVPFFDNRPDRANPDELRIGVTLGFDGYQSRNLILCGLTPGPKELNADELQHFMKAYVDDLLRLYNDGILVKTPLYPNGRRVRVILLAVCCDHPALCRIAGFGDHNTKEGFCPRCKIKHADLKTEAGLTIDVLSAFPLRDGEEHRHLAKEYLQQPDRELREAFFKEHAVRYYELSRLPYFDAVRMTIIDPMHNILLGIVKTQWLDGWIHSKALRERTSGNKVPRELDQIHEYLKDFEIPRWAARLPHDVGYPAGGSLTADEWKGLALNYGPIIMPLIWDEWQPGAQAFYDKKLAEWTKKDKQRIKRIAKGKRRADDTQEPATPKPQPRMHAQDADNFLSLASALKILMARSIAKADLPRARQLLQDYLLGFMKIDDYGPVYGFWTFLTERLNKVLKSYSTNNHDGGELEVTFFRAFSRDVRLRTLLNELASSDNPGVEEKAASDVARLILKTDGDQRGTVAALAHPNAQVEHDLRSRFSLDGGALEILDRKLQLELPHFLNTNIRKHNYVVLDGRRIRPSRGQGSHSPDSIIQANFADKRYVGEVFEILTHYQHGIGLQTHLLYVRWFSRLTDVDTSPWDPYPELEVNFWEYNHYLNPAHSGPPAFILVSDVLSQACRVAIKLFPVRPQAGNTSDDSENETARVPRRVVWVTTGLSRSLFSLGQSAINLGQHSRAHDIARATPQPTGTSALTCIKCTGIPADCRLVLNPADPAWTSLVKIKPMFELRDHPGVFTVGDTIAWNEQKPE